MGGCCSSKAQPRASSTGSAGPPAPTKRPEINRSVSGEAPNSLWETPRNTSDAPAGEAGAGAAPLFVLPAPRDSHAESERIQSRSLSELDAVLIELENRLLQIMELCKKVQVLRAGELLESLEMDTAIAERNFVEAEGHHKLRALAEKIATTPLLQRVRLTARRMRATLAAMPEFPKMGDPKWQEFSVKDTAVHEEFEVFVQIRFLEGAERIPNGPSTQLVCVGGVRNFPTPLDKLLAVDQEVDLLKNDMYKHCEKLVGERGLDEKLQSVMQRTQICHPLMPWRLEDIVLREFSVCPVEMPFGEKLPGIVVHESSPPADKAGSTWEGWELPPISKGIVRVNSDGRMFCKYPSRTPGCINITGVSFFSGAVPQWLLPLSLVKKFLANFLKTTAADVMTVVSRFEECGFSQRISERTELYHMIRTVGSEAATSGTQGGEDGAQNEDKGELGEV